MTYTHATSPHYTRAYFQHMEFAGKHSVHKNWEQYLAAKTGVSPALKTLSHLGIVASSFELQGKAMEQQLPEI